MDQEKVTFHRARQMLESNFEAPNQKPKPIFPTHFDITLALEHKRKISPFLLEKCIQNHTGTKPRTIRTKDATTFIIEISSHKESVAMTVLDKIHNHPVKTTINNTSDIQKGLIYVYGYDMSSFEDFKTGLINQNNLINVEEAIWMKPKRGNNAKPLILSFRRDVPAFIDVPGEAMRTRVSDYSKRPILCLNCLQYGHSRSVCRDSAKCRNCESAAHTTTNCTSEI